MHGIAGTDAVVHEGLVLAVVDFAAELIRELCAQVETVGCESGAEAAEHIGQRGAAIILGGL